MVLGGGALVARADGRAGTTLYRKSLLKAAVEALKDSVGEKECVDTLGIHRVCLSSLTHRGLIKPLSHAEALTLAGNERRFDRASFEELVSRLSNVAMGPFRTRMPLATAMIGVANPHIWANVVSALVSGTLPVAGWNVSEKSIIGTILVDSTLLERVVVEGRHDPIPEVAVSYAQAARILGIHDALVGGAVRAGLLISSMSEERPEVALAELDRFARSFVVPSEGAFLFKMSPRQFGDQMRAYGYVPAAIALTTHIWSRSDVRQALVRSRVQRNNPSLESLSMKLESLP
jgi:hypothetical protein